LLETAVIVYVHCSCSWLIGSSSVGSHVPHQYHVLARLTALKWQTMEHCNLRSRCHATQLLDRHSTHQNWSCFSPLWHYISYH